MIEILKSILFGIVEGITEWLPVSSTGHMILLDELVKLTVSEDPVFNREFYSMFEVVIQLGAILAVLLIFFDKLLNAKLWLKVVVAVLPSAIVGVLLDDWLDANLYNYITVAIALIVYGVAFLLVEKYRKKEDSEEISYPKAIGIGLFQCLALIPGTSRSGSTILGGMLLGLSRTAASEFSFFLAIPTMAGASLLRGFKFVKYVAETGTSVPISAILCLAAGFVFAFAVSMLTIRFLMEFVKKHSFAAFGVYRILLGALVLLFFVWRS